MNEEIEGRRRPAARIRDACLGAAAAMAVVLAAGALGSGAPEAGARTPDGAASDPPVEAVEVGGAAGPEEEVLAAVQTLFDAMEDRDVETAGRILHPDGQLFRVPIPFDGVPSPTPHREFVENLGSHGPLLQERMKDPEVLVHRRIAVAWTPYDFHLDGEFSHCGVNAFTLVETDEGWRILGIAYTLEPEGCPAGLGPGGDGDPGVEGRRGEMR